MLKWIQLDGKFCRLFDLTQLDDKGKFKIRYWDNQIDDIKESICFIEDYNPNSYVFSISKSTIT